ncbi:hypothetical protein [Mucilaginibacter sp. PAMB04168]|uniref:hypothetical protein n=1 Tax=Mucilaginibacter sp. PAMB04168 TaxID=3138567 RepID=UPI0031F62541
MKIALPVLLSSLLTICCLLFTPVQSAGIITPAMDKALPLQTAVLLHENHKLVSLMVITKSGEQLNLHAVVLYQIRVYKMPLCTM